MPGIWLAWMTGNIIGLMRPGMISHTNNCSMIISLWEMKTLQIIFRIRQIVRVQTSYMNCRKPLTQIMYMILLLEEQEMWKG